MKSSATGIPPGVIEVLTAKLMSATILERLETMSGRNQVSCSSASAARRASTPVNTVKIRLSICGLWKP